MAKWFGTVIVTAALIFTGCKKTAEISYKEMGDKAPSFNSSPELNTVQGFLLGFWTDAQEHSSKDGMIEPLYEFKPDSTFVIHRPKAKMEIAGTYQAAGSGIDLKYETINGKTIAAVLAESRKEAETGSQAGLYNDFLTDFISSRMEKLTHLEVDKDQVHAVFTPPGGVDQNDPLAAMQVFPLERVMKSGGP